MAVDGYLNFDTKINTSGFIKGIKSIGNAAYGAATSIMAMADRVVASFSKITAAYQTQIEAEARFEATIRNSASATNEQIQSVKDLASSLQALGVVGDEVQLAGAQELSTYVGSVESVKQMLPVLDDMIAQQYGFSASTDSAVTIATMLGKVLQGQTSALSRYGYSFDEAQEQLLKYGTEQQRVATLAAVVEESVSGVNEALANTPTGKVKQLSNDFGDLQETMGKLLTDVAYPLIVKLDVIVKKLNEVFSAAIVGIKNMLGISDDFSLGSSVSEVDDASEDVTENFTDIADEAERAEKANRKSLAVFDELNVLSQDEPTAEAALDAETLGDDVEPVELPVELEKSAFETAVDDLTDNVKEKWERFVAFTEPLRAALERLGETLKPIAQHVGSGLLWLFEKVLKPLASWSIGEAFPTFIDCISGFLQLVDKIGDIVGRTLKDMWDNFFSKIAGFVGDSIVIVLSGLGQLLKDIANNTTAVTTLIVIAEVIGTIVAAIVIIPKVLAAVKAIPTLIAALSNPLGWVIAAVAGIVVVIVEVITYWDVLKEAWLEGVDTISRNMDKFWKNLKDGAKSAWEGAKSVFSKVADFFGDVFSRAWQKVKDVFSAGGAIFNGIKEGIAEMFKGVVNSLIDGINNVVAFPFNAINSALITISEHIPFVELPLIDVPQIPHLAQGTVIPANYGEFAAILGDNKREAEVVSPVSAMKQAFREALSEAGMMSNSFSSSGDIVIQIDSREVFRATKKEAEHWSRMHGGRPAFG